MKNNSKKVLELALSLACVEISFNDKIFLNEKMFSEKRKKHIEDLTKHYIETAKRNLLHFTP